MISGNSSITVLKYRQKHRIFMILLIIFSILAFSGSVVLTVFPIRRLVDFDKAELKIEKVDRLMAELELLSFRLLAVSFNKEISEDFIAVQKDFLPAIRDSLDSVVEPEVLQYFNFLEEYLIPHMKTLNVRVKNLQQYEEGQRFSGLSLDERIFYYQQNLYRENVDMGYFLILSEAVQEIIFLQSDISSVYGDLLNKAKGALAQSRASAYRSFDLSLTFFLLTVFLLLTLFVIRRYENARIAEIEAQSRNEELERLVHLRTSELEKTRNVLVEQEKMAALGGLVAGVAHEVNTPLGIGVTAASYISEKIRDSPEKELDRLAIEDAAGLILSNLQRASKLIQGFKRVAVDESGETVRIFNLVDYLSEDVLPSIKHIIQKRGHEIYLEGLDSLVLSRNPGDFAQIVSNLVINASVHGYGSIKPGVIGVKVEREGNKGILTISDRGSGMDADTEKRMYDPFFTTNRKAGGSGLGLMLVYNLVNQKLMGRLDCRTAPGEGTDFIVSFPIEDPEEEISQK